MTTPYALGFVTQSDEMENARLPVKGEIPAWLSGTLIRNGPGQFEVEDRCYRHWFDGLAMLHRFTFQDGQVAYANRFLRSGAFEGASRTGRMVFGEFATGANPRFFAWLWSLVFPRPSDNAGVNVSILGGSHVAMTESDYRIRFDPTTLETLGPFRYADNVRGQLTTAHPHYDFERRETLNFITQMGLKSHYHVYRIKDGGRRRDVLTSIPVTEPGYMHSFGVTRNYVVLVEYPFVVRPPDLFFGRRPFIENFRWLPERGTRFMVADRNGKGLHGIYTTDPVFAFHHINAYEEDRQIVVDLATYEDNRVIDGLYLEKLRQHVSEIPVARLSRYRVSLSSGSVRQESTLDLALELPRINYRTHNMSRHRFVFGISRLGATRGINDGLVKADLESGETTDWSEDGCYAGEPVFVTSPGAASEDDGVVLSVILDVKAEKSFLLVLDGRSFTELARAHVPQHIPFGFHGQFYEIVGGADS